MDNVILQVTNNRLDNCVTVFTETLLHENIPDLAVEIAGHSLHRVDCTVNSGKTRGGGESAYIHNSWCTDTTVIERHCCLNLEFLMLKCRPFYLPREFSTVLIIAVYIHSRANANLAMTKLYDAICKQQNKHPESIFIVAGDFYYSGSKTVLPKFYKNMDIKTRKNKTLDQVYTNVIKCIVHLILDSQTMGPCLWSQPTSLSSAE